MLSGAPLGKAQALAGLSTQTGPRGELPTRAPQRWEPLSAWLCAPHPSQPRVAWPLASSVWKGGLGTELHMGKLLQKNPAMLLDNVQLSQAVETSAGLGW